MNVYDVLYFCGFILILFTGIAGVIIVSKQNDTITNADIIREMDDDQLDEFLAKWEERDIDYAVTFCDLCMAGGNELGLDCDGCRKYWLQSDARAYNGLLRR